MPLSSKFWKFSTGIREKSSKWDVHSKISLIHQNFLLLGKKNNKGLSHQQSPGTMQLNVHASLCLEERGTKEIATNSLSLECRKGPLPVKQKYWNFFLFLSQYSRKQGGVYIYTDYSDTSKFSWTELKRSVSLVQVICWAKSNCRQTALGGYSFEIYAIFSKAFCPAMGESNHFVTVNFYLFTNGL